MDRVCRVRIDGMTCGSCVANIEGHIGEQAGIGTVKVDLANASGTVVYDSAQWTGESVAEAIDDMGFDCRCLQDQRRVQLATVKVSGMTCQSCVANIEGTIGDKIGVQFIKVSLAEAGARVVFDTSLTTGETLAEHIDDMGFDAELLGCTDDIPAASKSPSTADLRPPQSITPVLNARRQPLLLPNGDGGSPNSAKSSVVDGSKTDEFDDIFTAKSTLSASPAKTAAAAADRKLKPKLRIRQPSDSPVTYETCTLSVSGMTCASCVANIERNLKKVDGIGSVLVALIAGKAEVEYDSFVILPGQIANAVTELGYPAEVIDNASHTGGCIEFQLTGLTGSTSASLPPSLDATLRRRPGVTEVTYDAKTRRLRVNFSPELVGQRDLLYIIQDSGVAADVVPADGSSRLPDHAKQIRKWRHAFLFSLVFGIPVMLVMIYYHWWLQSHMRPDKQTMIVKGLSIDNALLFLLCTPVQLFGARQFYVASYQALKHGTTTMDVLIVLATSIAYIYSVGILVAAIVLRWPASPKTFFDVPPMLIVFIALGRWMENVAKTDRFRAVPVSESHILMIANAFAPSHSRMYYSLAERLLRRGHRLTILHWGAMHSTKDIPLPKGAHVVVLRNDTIEWIEDTFDYLLWDSDYSAHDMWRLAARGAHIPLLACQALMDSPELHSRLVAANFSLAIVDIIGYPCSRLIAQQLNVPHVVLAGTPPYLHLDWDVVPNMFAAWPVGTHFLTHLRGIRDRITCLFGQFCMTLTVYWWLQERLGALLYGMSPVIDGPAIMTFAYSHTLIDMPRPVSTAYQYIALPPKVPHAALFHMPALEPVGCQQTVVISFTTMGKKEQMPMKMRLAIAQATKRFPDVCFLWRTKIEVPAQKALHCGNNVQFVRWFNQTNLFAAESTTALVTSLGVFSMYEALTHNVSIIAIPLAFDQPGNAVRVARAQAGTWISKQNVSAGALVDALQLILAPNSTLRRGSSTVSTMLSAAASLQTDPLLWHTEYAARHPRQHDWIGIASQHRLSYAVCWCADVVFFCITLMLFFGYLLI